jgi:hypothetical protein
MTAADPADPVLTDADERLLLAEIARLARRLAESGDPLMRGQYQNLAGRVSALRAIKGEELP